MSKKKKDIDHDSEWKLLITELFEDCVAYFLPEVYPLIDFSIPPEFLDKDLYQLIRRKFKEKKIVDCLGKVHLKTGKTKWILIHIEVQSSHETDFSRRMYWYYVLIDDKFDNPDIESIAIFTGKGVPRKHNQYVKKTKTTSLTYKYKSFIVKKQDEEELKKDKNPFALAVLAALYVIKSGKDLKKRYEYKKELIKLARERNYTNKQILALLLFLLYLVKLPKELTLQFNEEIIESYKNDSMQTYTEWRKDFATKFFQGVFGDTPENVMKKFIAEEKEAAKQEMRRIKEEALKATKKANEEARKATEEANEEARKAIEKARKAEQKLKQQEAKNLKIIKSLLVNGSMNQEQIANIFNVQQSLIEQIAREIKHN